MRPSTLKTITVTGSGTESPSTIITAGSLPMRVLIRNVGPTLVFLAHQASSLQGAIGFAASEVFQLPAGVSEVFVLADKQGLYAVSQGGGGQLSFAASEAVPTMKLES